MVVLPPLTLKGRVHKNARNRGLYSGEKPRSGTIRYPQERPAVPKATRISLDDVIYMAEHRREVVSQQSRRLVMEEAHRALRNERGTDRSRPHSVVGPGLQSLTSPMPSPSRPAGQIDHIPSLLPLPSDRTFIPSPDQHHDRHVTNTPTEHFRLEGDNRHHPVAQQCCEIMGPSLCRSCRRLESRAQNRKSAELECPRMRSAGGRGRQTFSLTQVVKRSYPRLSDAEIQDKLARGEIARLSFPWVSRSGQYDDEDSDTIRNIDSCNSSRTSDSDKDQNSCHDDDDDDDEEDKDILHIDPGTYRANTPLSRPASSVVDCEKEGIHGSKMVDLTDNKTAATTGGRQQLTKASLSTKNAFYVLAKLALKLQGSTTTPLFFSDLRGMQGKILSGTVDRKAYMTLRPDAAGQRSNQKDLPSRLKSAVSTTSTSSGKSGLSKLGSQLSREFMPAFVSPRKVKLIEEPKYKVYFEPPLLTKRRQIPNPSFFAGSTDEYSLPERLPDVIEFADSQRIAAMEKQIRAGTALSFVSSMSDEQQQQQTPVGYPDQQISLALDKDDDSVKREQNCEDGRPASSRGSKGERGVSTPTPRSTMRVSSGGPLSSRTVPEENEEDLQKELKESEEAVADNHEIDERTDKETELKPQESESNLGNKNKLGILDEISNKTQTNVENSELCIEANSLLGKDLEGSKEITNDELSGCYTERQQIEAMYDGEEVNEGKFSDNTIQQEEKDSELSGNRKFYDAEELEIVDESATTIDDCFPFFLTNRALTSELESHTEEEVRAPLEHLEEEINDKSEGNVHGCEDKVIDNYNHDGRKADDVGDAKDNTVENESVDFDEENEEKWWRT
ncbi:hypothetical protein RRG08_033918 [Elysia crispata]|uniref:Uncharacterized protein n=1 Tax=Elysia crispata TaxID=231223 RepID=A0AAE1ECK7_9GAST|nr:hypothetical protein RRG08_033918 [Elysia crispata]